MSFNEKEYVDPENDTSTGGKLEYTELLIRQFDSIRIASNSGDLARYGAAIEEMVIELYPSLINNKEIYEKLKYLETKRDNELKKIPRTFNRDMGSMDVDTKLENRVWLSYYREVHKQLYLLLDKLGLLLEKFIYEIYE